MLLSELAAGYQVLGQSNPDITGISEDSRRIRPGMLFVAIRGTVMDGHAFVADARSRGAAAVLVEGPAPEIPIPVVRTGDARSALADLAARFHGHPARNLKLIGFTGTFGKTSTSAILRSLLEAAGARAGVLGSLGARFGDVVDTRSVLTTPAPVELQAALAGLSAAGARTVIMEVTSHALRLQRVQGLTFQGGLISAIKPGEHSDFHGSYEDYVAAKRRLLEHLDRGATLAFDADNRAARTVAGDAAVAVKSGVSLQGRPAAWQVRNVTLDHSGAHFTLNRRRLHSSLLGRGNLENAALALAFALADGATVDGVRPVLRRLEPLSRRMERSLVDGRLVLDDTAGHPDSLRATFEVADMLLRSPAVSPGGRTVVVYAVRGNRGEDINRRNAAALADLAAEHGVRHLMVTASLDVAGPNDRTSAGEIDATRAALAARIQPFDWFDELAAATQSAMSRTSPGDLIVLVGAQGMNEGQRLLRAAL